MARRNKYGAVRTEVDGIKFHSKKEAARYVVLRDMLRDGLITDLRLQVSHQITVNGFKICRYVSDFEYIEDGVQIVEDVKSVRTSKEPVFRLKKKLMKACLGIEVYEYI